VTTNLSPVRHIFTATLEFLVFGILLLPWDFFSDILPAYPKGMQKDLAP
jgi:hypothetical protein